MRIVVSVRPLRRLTPAITCGPRRARALRAACRASGELNTSRARDRPDRQVHGVVSWPFAHGTPCSSPLSLQIIRPCEPVDVAKHLGPSGQRAVNRARAPEVGHYWTCTEHLPMPRMSPGCDGASCLPWSPSARACDGCAGAGVWELRTVARTTCVTSETTAGANEPCPPRLAKYSAANFAPPRLLPCQLFKYS